MVVATEKAKGYYLSELFQISKACSEEITMCCLVDAFFLGRVDG